MVAVCARPLSRRLVAAFAVPAVLTVLCVVVGSSGPARAGTSYMGIATPAWTSVTGSWRTWLGS